MGRVQVERGGVPVGELETAARGLSGGSERGAALGSVVDAVALVDEHAARVRNERLPSPVLAEVRSVVVAALGRQGKTSPNHAHRTANAPMTTKHRRLCIAQPPWHDSAPIAPRAA